MPKAPLEPAPAYENAQLIARDLVSKIMEGLDEDRPRDEEHTTWADVGHLLELNAALMESVKFLAAL